MKRKAATPAIFLRTPWISRAFEAILQIGISGGDLLLEFGWSDEQTATRERIETLLATRMPPGWEEASAHGPGSDEQVAYARQFCPILGAERLLVGHWPREYGGDEAGIWDQYILREALYAIGEPRGPQYMNSNWIGPSIMRYGTPEQKAHHLPMIAAGTVSWCQGFSEPSAGSDLAALRTRAERVGNGYRINGSKIWTSYSQAADYCFLLARTGEGKKTITVFLLPMTTPGIQVKPIKALVCDGSLNEVFFTDVYADDSMRLGEEDKGWEVVTYALAQERVGSPKHVYAMAMLEKAVEHLQSQDRFDDARVRERAARALAVCDAAQKLNYRCVDNRAKGKPDTAENNMARVLQSKGEHLVSDFIADFLPEVIAGAALAPLKAYVRRTASAAIGAGSAEIQLNLIARNWLDLPRGE